MLFYWRCNNNFLLHSVDIAVVIHCRSSSSDAIVRRLRALKSRFASCVASSSTFRFVVDDVVVVTLHIRRLQVTKQTIVF